MIEVKVVIRDKKGNILKQMERYLMQFWDTEESIFSDIEQFIADEKQLSER